jgi:hypothetical protein
MQAVSARRQAHRAAQENPSDAQTAGADYSEARNYTVHETIRCFGNLDAAARLQLGGNEYVLTTRYI